MTVGTAVGVPAPVTGAEVVAVGWSGVDVADPPQATNKANNPRVMSTNGLGKLIGFNLSQLLIHHDNSR